VSLLTPGLLLLSVTFYSCFTLPKWRIYLFKSLIINDINRLDQGLRGRSDFAPDLMVNGRSGEAHELMRDLERTNCTKLGSDAHIMTREYDYGPQHCDAQSQATTFQGTISPELWGSTLYILTTFGLSDFLYFGIAYIYPLVLQDLYEDSLDGIFQICSR
jgi:hypothetical protein